MPVPEGRKLLERAMKELHLSARAYYKILKIARTLADLETVTDGATVCEDVKIDIPIKEHHVAEAIQYRSLDRQW